MAQQKAPNARGAFVEECGVPRYAAVTRAIAATGQLVSFCDAIKIVTSENKKAGLPNIVGYFGNPAVSVRPVGFPPHSREWFSIVVYRPNFFCMVTISRSICQNLSKGTFHVPHPKSPGRAFLGSGGGTVAVRGTPPVRHRICRQPRKTKAPGPRRPRGF
jgi:hypothetical protein